MSSVSSIGARTTSVAAQFLQQIAANRAIQKTQARTSPPKPTEETSESSAEQATETETGEGQALDVTA